MNKAKLHLEVPLIGEVHSYQRWSTDAQTWGDSERRQNALTEAYCTANGLPLPKKSYSDSGLTGKDGRNRQAGSALAELLKVVKPTDLILIEDCDRWSREDPITSLYEMRNVLKAKSISIRFLNEGITVNQANFMQDGIILPLFFKSFLGNRENTKKGERIKQVIGASKTAFIETGKRFGQKPPSWLKWNDDTKQYDLNEDKGKLVLRIFKMLKGGMGGRRIAKIFNEVEHIPVMNKYVFKSGKRPPHKWSASYIVRIARNKAVLGYRGDLDGEKHKMFPPIPGMTETLFYDAQRKIEERNIHLTGGRPDEGQNLFTGLLKCSDPECQANMRPRPAKRKYGTEVYRLLYCSGQLQGRCSVKGNMNYDRLEESFFGLMTEPRFKDTIIAKVYPKEDKEDPLVILQGKLTDARKRLERYSADYAKLGSNSDTLLSFITKTEQEIKDVLRQIDETKIVSIGTTMTGQAYNEWNQLVKDGWNKPENRMKIREAIAELVDHISVDTPNKCYDVFFKPNPDKPVHVKMFKNGYRIEGDVNANFFWQHTMPTRKDVEQMAEQSYGDWEKSVKTALRGLPNLPLLPAEKPAKK